MMSEETNSFMLALTETHLSPSICDAEVYMEGFHIYRADREGGRAKGGVAIYLRNDLAADTEIMESGSDGYVEYLMIHIKKYDLVIIAMYNPPGAHQQRLERAVELLKDKFLAMGDPSPSLVVCGDFNMPRTNWAHSEARNRNSSSQCLFSLMDELFLSQIRTTPTRGQNILDLCFINKEDMIEKREVQETNMSDHKLVVIDTLYNLNTQKHHQQ